MEINRNSYFSKKITFLNVFLTFIIVVLHAKTPERWGLPLDMTFPFIYVVNVFTQIGVPMFFFISGLLFYKNCSFNDIERKLRSRVRSLLIPYILWNSLFVFIFWGFTHVSFIHDKMNMGDVLNDPKEIIYAVLNARYTVLWFVKDLMIFCLFSAGLFVALEKKYMAYLVLLLSFFNACLNNYGYESIFNWFPMYFIGALWGKFYVSTKSTYYGNILNLRNVYYRSLWSVLLLLIFLFLFYISVVNNSYLFFYRFFSPVILWILVDLLFKEYIQKSFVVKKWMSYTFFVFCTHQFLLNVLQKMVVLKFPATSLVLNITFVVSPIIVVLLSIFIARILSGFRFYSYLSGGR